MVTIVLRINQCKTCSLLKEFGKNNGKNTQLFDSSVQVAKT